MLKKILIACAVTTTILVTGVTLRAQGNDFFKSDFIKKTEDTILKITRPEDGETTYKKSCVVCGVINDDSTDSEINVNLYIKDKDTGSFVALENTDGESNWTVSSGLFLKEVELPNKGANLIRLTAYKGDDPQEAYESGNYQVDEFTVNLLDRDFKNIIKNGLYDFTKLDWLLGSSK